MGKTLVSCPNCRQPITAEIEQLFDVGSNPSAKQELLSGSFNQINCPVCGYRGVYPSILVYHDPSKELLLTYAPPELNLPRNDQERLTGQLINQVINKLPLEQRKGYLFNPQAVFTVQGLVERVLEGEGITREMVQQQQLRLNLLQRLLSASSSEIRAELARQEDSLIDETFFALLRRLVQSAELSGDQAAMSELDELQMDILNQTTFGRELQEQAKEMEAAAKDLQSLGRQITREQLLGLFLKAPNDNYLRSLTSLARPGMDYQFFQLLSERIERARGDGRERLADMREKLLIWTQEIDKQLEAHVKEIRSLIKAIIESDDIDEAMSQSIPYVDDFFLQELNQQLENARNQADLEKISKFQKMVAVIEQASQPAEEVDLIEELLNVTDDDKQTAAWNAILDKNADKITPDFLNVLMNIANQLEQGNDKQMANRFRELNRVALRYSMERNLRKVEE